VLPLVTTMELALVTTMELALVLVSLPEYLLPLM